MRVLVGWPDASPEPSTRVGVTATGAPVTFEPVAGFPTTRASSADLQVLVAGWIYNRASLAATLTALEPAAPQDEAGVVMRLWDERGVAALAALRGAFAVAVWDARRRRLVVARDQLGLVPLYVIGERDRLAASVSLPALLALPGVALTWDAVAIDALLSLGTVPPPATPYLGVRQLAPGESLLWEEGRQRVQRWWQLAVPDRRATRGDGAQAVRERLAEAVRLRAGGARTTLCLSGGLDALAILALATAQRRVPPSAVTFARVRDGALEVRQAARAAAWAHVQHVVLDSEPDWAAVSEAILDVHGMPIAGFDVPYLGLAVRSGWRLLAGHGGEAILGGSAAHREWLALARMHGLPGVLRDLLQLGARVSGRKDLTAIARDRPLAALACVRRAVRRLDVGVQDDLYTPEARLALDERRGDELLGALAADAVAAGADHPLDVIHHVILHLALSQLAALHCEAASRGGDLRLPLVDHRLAQVVLGVAPELRGSAFGRQLLLRRALRADLPRALARQPPRRLAPPPDAWAREPLRGLLETSLAPAAIAAAGVFQPETVGRLVSEHRAGVADHGECLWNIIVVSRWLRRVGWPSARVAVQGEA